MISEDWLALSSFVMCVGLPVLGLRLVIRNVKRRCEETQAEIRRLVALFEPETNHRSGQANYSKDPDEEKLPCKTTD